MKNLIIGIDLESHDATIISTTGERVVESKEVNDVPGRKDKTTVGINIEIPKEDYRRLQNMRINLDGIPLRTLALQLVLQGIDRYERGL